MALLSLSLLGPLQVTLVGTPVVSFESDKVRALLFYLAVEADRAHRREVLAGLLWPEQPERIARHSLSQALFNLRQVIADQRATPPYFWITRETIQFNTASEHWVDTAVFSELLVACDHHRHQSACIACAGRLERAVGLYRGSFLQEFSVAGSVAFEEWAHLKRERLHRQMIDALGQLTGYYERHGAYPQARRSVWRQLELDAWREEAHRALMRLLMLDGQRSAALAQYETCRRALAADLGVEPDPETIALYERIQAAEPQPTRAE